MKKFASCKFGLNLTFDIWHQSWQGCVGNSASCLMSDVGSQKSELKNFLRQIQLNQTSDIWPPNVNAASTSLVLKSREKKVQIFSALGHLWQRT